jgi:hypothetical protein
MRRNAAFTMFSLMGREPLRRDGNIGRALCCSPIFIFSAGMRKWGSAWSGSHDANLDIIGRKKRLDLQCFRLFRGRL